MWLGYRRFRRAVFSRNAVFTTLIFGWFYALKRGLTDEYVSGNLASNDAMIRFLVSMIALGTIIVVKMELDDR